MQEITRVVLEQLNDNLRRTSSSGNIPRPRPWTEDFDSEDRRSSSRSNDNDQGYRSVSVMSDSHYSEFNKENVRPGSGLQELTHPATPPSTRGDSQSPSRTPTQPTCTGGNTVHLYKIKNEVVIKNPRDGFPHLPLKSGTWVQVYYDSKFTSQSNPPHLFQSPVHC